MQHRVENVGFLLIDGFALMSASSAIEPLRAANHLAGETRYTLHFLSQNGGRATASCGAIFDTQPLTGADPRLDILFVVAGGDPMTEDHSALFGPLRARAAHGTALGGISGGAVILARADLMEHRRFTVHWQHFDALQARSETYLMERRLFVIDRDRATCAGGVAPLDMMFALIRARHGADLAQSVSDWFIHTGIRSADDPQRIDAARARPDLHKSVATALDLMRNHLAHPLNMAALARLSGASERHLQRLFAETFGHGLKAHYLDLRLKKADELLCQSALPISEIAFTTGFGSQAHFSRSYRAAFGQSPRERRSSRKSA